MKRGTYARCSPWAECGTRQNPQATGERGDETRGEIVTARLPPQMMVEERMVNWRREWRRERGGETEEEEVGEKKWSGFGPVGLGTDRGHARCRAVACWLGSEARRAGVAWLARSIGWTSWLGRPDQDALGVLGAFAT
jgi:hypothetical protein